MKPRSDEVKIARDTNAIQISEKFYIKSTHNLIFTKEFKLKNTRAMQEPENINIYWSGRVGKRSSRVESSRVEFPKISRTWLPFVKLLCSVV